MAKQRLELTWYNKDKALIPTEQGKYGYQWVDPEDPRYCETHTLIYEEYVEGKQSPKFEKYNYSHLADLEPQKDNLMVLGESGDTLETLTRVPELADKYIGNIKLAYLDPPFNTAKTFASYEDNLEHSVWLTMMRDRLLHIYRLLSDDGSIWVHLDTSENHRMRSLLDEIFGEQNFVTEIVWGKADTSRNDAKQFSVDQDYIYVYSRNPEWKPNRLPRTSKQDSIYSSPDGDPHPWLPKPGHGPAAATHQGMVYAVQSPITGELLYPPVGCHWRLGQEQMHQELCKYADYDKVVLDDAERRAEVCGVAQETIKSGVPALLLKQPFNSIREQVKKVVSGILPMVFFINDGKTMQIKGYLPERGTVPRTIWNFREAGSNRNSKAEIKKLFPDKFPFATPKPEKLLQRIIHIATNPGDIVLDCFGGSGTTAAVAQKMGRKWVTCELLEENFNTYIKPRLTKVVKNEDDGGITRTAGERVASKDVILPEGVLPEDAVRFNFVLKKLIEGDEKLKNSNVVKRLKSLSQTQHSKEVVNWRGGGGFQVAHLSPECFTYSNENNRVLLTNAAKGDMLVRSVAANLGFNYIKGTPGTIFDGRRGKNLLKVIVGVTDTKIADWLVSHITPDETIVIATTSLIDGVRQHLRKKRKGAKIVMIPDDIFPYSINTQK